MRRAACHKVVKAECPRGECCFTGQGRRLQYRWERAYTGPPATSIVLVGTMIIKYIPIFYAVALAACSLANVHGSGAVGSFTILLVALEASRGLCSTEMWPLVVADHSQASALLVCTVYTIIVQSYLGRISGSYVSVWTHGMK